ncbi:MAG: hypothetical protein ACK40M_15065, partial [Flavobacteriales bacterium]
MLLSFSVTFLSALSFSVCSLFLTNHQLSSDSDLLFRRVVHLARYANSVGATHFYTSAKMGVGINEAFMDLAKRFVIRFLLP